MRPIRHACAGVLLIVQVAVLWVASLQAAWAMPEFARRYSLSCAACHAAFPRLNKFGEQFLANNLRLPNWKDSTAKTGDDLLALPAYPPLAVRGQAYVQARERAIEGSRMEDDRAAGASLDLLHDVIAVRVGVR